ncbi:IQ calmodulin-binding motif family protein, putative, partial [Ichthyophthirius multifiliis]
SGFVYEKQDINVQDENQNTALYYAVKHQNIEFVNFLLSKGADINKQCFKGNTALHMAFKVQNEQIIMDLMQNGGDLNILNQYNQSPLAFGNIEFLKKLDYKNVQHLLKENQLPLRIIINYILINIFVKKKRKFIHEKYKQF